MIAAYLAHCYSYGIVSKKRLSIEEAARELTDIAIEHLAQFPEGEQEARIEAFKRLNLKARRGMRTNVINTYN